VPDRLWLLEPLAVPVARPHPDPLPTVEPVVTHPHDGLGAIGRSTNAGLLDEAPAPAGLGEDGVGVVVHSGGESRRRLMVGMGRKVDEVLEDLVTETR
jgi:hypothetical protein